MRLKLAPLSLLGAVAVAGLLASSSRPASAIALPVIDIDAVPNWVIQDANMAKTLIADGQRYLQLAHEITDADQQLKQLGSMRFGSANSLQQFTNFAVTSQNRYPTAFGSVLANSLVQAQLGTGTLSPTDLTNMASEIGGAVGVTQTAAAQEDVQLATLSQAQNAQKFAAAQDLQRQNDELDASHQRAALMDTNSAPTAGMQY